MEPDYKDQDINTSLYYSFNVNDKWNRPIKLLNIYDEDYLTQKIQKLAPTSYNEAAISGWGTSSFNVSCKSRTVCRGSLIFSDPMEKICITTFKIKADIKPYIYNSLFIIRVPTNQDKVLGIFGQVQLPDNYNKFSIHEGRYKLFTQVFYISGNDYYSYYYVSFISADNTTIYNIGIDTYYIQVAYYYNNKNYW